MTVALTLPERLDTSAAPELADTLAAELGQDIEIDAAPVTHLGALCLQVLLSAAKTWAARGQSLTISNINDTMAGQLTLFGVTPDHLGGPRE